MTKTKRVRKPTTKRTLTKPTQARIAAMNACAPIVTQEEIAAALRTDKVDVSRTSVGFILHGGWYNAEVVRVFCELTGTAPSKMWPEFLDKRTGKPLQKAG